MNLSLKTIAAGLLAATGLQVQAQTTYEMKLPRKGLVVSGASSSGYQPPPPADTPTQQNISVSTSAVSLDFGSVRIGQQKTLAVSLLNSGEGTVTLTSAPSVQGAGYSLNTNCGATLMVGAECQASVTFQPSAAQAYSGSLAFGTNASNSPALVSLAGVGAYPLGASFDFSAGSFGVETTSGIAGQRVLGAGTITRSGSTLQFSPVGPTDTGYVDFLAIPGSTIGPRDFVLRAVATRTSRNVSGSSYYSGQIAWLGMSDPERIGIWVKDADGTVSPGGQFPTMNINGVFYHAIDNPISLNVPVTYEVVRTGGQVQFKVNGQAVNLYTASSNSAASGRVLVGKTLSVPRSYDAVQGIRVGNAPAANRMFGGVVSSVSLTVTE